MKWWQALRGTLFAREPFDIRAVANVVANRLRGHCMVVTVEGDVGVGFSAVKLGWDSGCDMAETTAIAIAVMSDLLRRAENRARECPCPGCAETLDNVRQMVSGLHTVGIDVNTKGPTIN